MEWFWHVLVICVVVIPVAIMWLAIAFELFTRRDLKWWQRGAWLLVIFIFPIIGSLIYLGYTWITAGRRAPADASAVPRFGRQPSNVPDAEGHLASLDRLRRNGVLTAAEFDAGKRRVLEGTTPNGGPSGRQTINDSPKTQASDREPKHGAE